MLTALRVRSFMIVHFGSDLLVTLRSMVDEAARGVARRFVGGLPTGRLGRLQLQTVPRRQLARQSMVQGSVSRPSLVAVALAKG